MGFFDRFGAFVDPKENNEQEEFYDDSYDNAIEDDNMYDNTYGEEVQQPQRNSSRGSFFGGLGVSRHTNDYATDSYVDASMQIKVLYPSKYDEAEDIAKYLVDEKPVVFDLQYCDHETANNIVNFVSGAICALKGEIRKVNDNGSIFLATPSNVYMDSELKNSFEMDNYGPEAEEWLSRTYGREDFQD